MTLLLPGKLEKPLRKPTDANKSQPSPHTRYGRREHHTPVHKGSLGQDGVGRIDGLSKMYKGDVGRHRWLYSRCISGCT